jgi:hypothetical protein
MAVGAIDNPWPHYESTDWHLDDVLLQESHIGHGTFVSNAGTWSTRSDFAVNEGDTLYVMAYNLPKSDWLAAPLASRGVGFGNSQGQLVTQTVGPVINPQTFYFDDLRVGPLTCVAEPSALLLVLPALAVWNMRRRKRVR